MQVLPERLGPSLLRTTLAASYIICPQSLVHVEIPVASTTKTARMGTDVTGTSLVNRILWLRSKSVLRLRSFQVPTESVVRKRRARRSLEGRHLRTLVQRISPESMTQGALSEASQTSPDSKIPDTQHSDAPRPPKLAQPSPPHPPHASEQHTPDFSIPSSPLLQTPSAVRRKISNYKKRIFLLSAGASIQRRKILLIERSCPNSTREYEEHIHIYFRMHGLNKS